jgi:hypothetical protein
MTLKCTLTFDRLAMRRFYFEIPSANVLECIWAHSFLEAKAKASLTWMPWWNEIKWIDPQ